MMFQRNFIKKSNYNPTISYSINQKLGFKIFKIDAGKHEAKYLESIKSLNFSINSITKAVSGV